jgi:hypothetical protein
MAGLRDGKTTNTQGGGFWVVGQLDLISLAVRLTRMSRSGPDHRTAYGRFFHAQHGGKVVA